MFKSFLLVILVALFSVFSLKVENTMAYEILHPQAVSLDSPRISASFRVGYQHEHFFVFDNIAPFGTYFKVEKCKVDGGLENATVEIYRVPDGKTAAEVLPTFSNGGAELIMVMPEDGYDLLAKGQYIIKLIGPKCMARVNLIWNPRRVP